MNVGQPLRNMSLLHIRRCEPVTVSADAMTAMTHVTDRCHCPEWQTAISPGKMRTVFTGMG